MIKGGFSKGYGFDKEKDNEIEKMSKEMDELFELFLEKNDKFDAEKAFKELKRYFKRYQRIIYAPISNMIFVKIDQSNSGESDKFLGTISSNIGKTYDYANTEKVRKDTASDIYDKITISLIKMRDHVDLASNQYKSLKQSDDEFKRKFKKIIKPVQDKMERKVSSQLISLIGIFTAMAFLVFGGVNVLGEIAYGFHNASLIKLVLVTSLWGLCIVNMIFTFLFCISKMTKLKLSSGNGNFLAKYPIIWLSNWILITIFVISSWLYFSDQIGILQIVINFILNRPKFIFLFVFFLIIVVSVLVFYYLYKNYKSSKSASYFL